ncbi:MAG: 1-acyl-sn-glycerol-3-phosphate acyltransferase [Candidatus Omnitrophica bacterium]|nr:1-acyl-sn-glycerol-3-phosphate acyltransferase [Candidatus Omnitrophota bacterium]
MRLIISMLFWLSTGILTLGVFFVVFVLTILLFPFDKKRKLAHAQGFWWADILVSLNPFWSVKLSGLENIDPRKTYVIIANHQSLADIVMLYKTHAQFKWVAKEDLFRIPVFGWCMSRMKYIKLMRGEYASIKDVYQQASDWLNKGISVLFFPEGTRSATNQMNPFKNGAFKLAIKEQKPILPIYIGGTKDIIPRGSWVFRTKASCKLVVLPAIDTAGFHPEDFIKLKDIVREKLMAAQ